MYSLRACCVFTARLPCIHCEPAVGYDVERCEEGSTFWEAVPGVVSGTSHVVKGLVEGTRYKFRVKAQNVYGISEPATTDKSILAKNPFGTVPVINKI